MRKILGIETADPIIVRNEILPSDYISLPYQVRVVGKLIGWRAWLRRQLLMTTYSKFDYPLEIQQNWHLLNPDEKWLAATTRWRVWSHRVKFSIPENPNNHIQEFNLRSRCYPPGYEFRFPNGLSKIWPCDSLVCPYCYARNVSNYLKHLRKARNRRPKTEPLYAGKFQLVGSDKQAVKLLHSIRPAGAILFRYPVGRSGKIWVTRGVMVSDDRTRFKGLSTLRVTKPGGLAIALSRWLRYPPHWRRKRTVGPRSAIMALSTVKPKFNLFQSYGACRDDYVAGKGWYDYKAFEPV